MVAFLTSTPGGLEIREEKWLPAKLDPRNGFVDQLKQYWKKDSRCLFVSSNPNGEERNDLSAEIFMESFSMSGLPLAEIQIWDNRLVAFTESGRPCSGAEWISHFDVMILGGGHVPTQNAFFEKIGLRELMPYFDGIVIGISAGSMNSGEEVYAMPEIAGEAVDPDYCKFVRGLGLTSLTMVPHYQMIKEDTLDGLRLMEEIAYPDSKGKTFYFLVDGSYLKIADGITQLYGEAWLLQDGTMKQICREDEILTIED